MVNFVSGGAQWEGGVWLVTANVLAEASHLPQHPACFCDDIILSLIDCVHMLQNTPDALHSQSIPRKFTFLICGV